MAGLKRPTAPLGGPAAVGGLTDARPASDGENPLDCARAGGAATHTRHFSAHAWPASGVGGACRIGDTRRRDPLRTPRQMLQWSPLRPRPWALVG
jgi:hypothetical protein